MSIYKISVREASYVEYEIEADSEQEAIYLIGMGDATLKDSSIMDSEIIEIEERES